MDGAGGLALFAGDLDDPWVAAIADALPERSPRLACPADLPDDWPELARSAHVLVVHRSILTDGDSDRLHRLRGGAGSGPRVVLCVGPYVRYHQIGRWSPLVDVILPEAIAPEVVARHADGRRARPLATGPRPRVVAVSGNFELRQMLADACGEAGYAAEPASDWSEVPPGGTVIWDVPLLEAIWPEILAREARHRKLIALLGFADRKIVGLARSRGASACLDLPCDAADLAFILDRLTAAGSRLADRAHAVPPAPTRFRVVRPEPERAMVDTPPRPVVDPAS